MKTDNSKNQTQDVGGMVPNLSNPEEVRKAIIASEILQRKW